MRYKVTRKCALRLILTPTQSAMYLLCVQEARHALEELIDTIRCHFHTVCLLMSTATGTEDERLEIGWKKWCDGLIYHCVHRKHDHCDPEAVCVKEPERHK